jgi:hypothetical protein
MTTDIKTSETNWYVTLARDVDLRTLAAGRDAIGDSSLPIEAVMSANTPQIPRQTR